jgi:transposase
VVEVVSVKEHEQLKAKVKQLEQERDILKKALGIFSRED